MGGNDPQLVNAVVQSEPAQEVFVVQQQPAAVHAPPGAPLGGFWVEERYCGIITWAVTLFCLCTVGVCTCCCPCDKRTVSEHHPINQSPMKDDFTVAAR